MPELSTRELAPLPNNHAEGRLIIAAHLYKLSIHSKGRSTTLPYKIQCHPYDTLDLVGFVTLEI